VNRAIDADFRSTPDVRAMENRSASSNKNLIADLGANHVAVGSYNTVISQYTRVTTCGSDYGIFQHDAVAANTDRAAGLRHKAGAMHDPAAGTDNDIAAHRGIRGNPRIGIDQRRMFRVRNDHS
jgi:hypothetical protein